MASTQYEGGAGANGGFFSTRHLEDLQFKQGVSRAQEGGPQLAWKSTIMSNSGISKEPERVHLRHDAIAFEKISEPKEMWSEKRSVASRTGGLIMGGSSILSGQHSANHSINHSINHSSIMSHNSAGPSGDELTFTHKIPSLQSRSVKMRHSSFESGDFGRPQSELYETSPRIIIEKEEDTPRQIGMLEEIASQGSSQKPIDSQQGLMNYPSTNPRIEALSRQTSLGSRRNTIKLIRQERKRANTEQRQQRTIEQIERDEIELEERLLEYGKTELPTMPNWHMNIDAQGLDEHFEDLSKERNSLCTEGPEAKSLDEPPKHPNVLEDSFVQIGIMNAAQKVRIYKDKYPCLRCRKGCMRFRVMVVQCCHAIIKSSIFEAISLIIIIANSITMALEDPSKQVQAPWLEALDYLFLALYTLEMLLKIFGLGFIMNEKAYLRQDSWNKLDFVIVVSGYITILLKNASFNLKVLRSFRVLRPLRTVSRLQGLRIIISALLTALPLLLDTIWILLFFFLIFAIAGLQLFQGELQKRCVAIGTDVLHPADSLCGGAFTCPEGFYCKRDVHNPPGGVNNFDNIFNSIITVFQCVTLEGWGAIMDNLWNSMNVSAVIFFVPLVFIGAFFLLNLTLAVIKSKFTDAHTKKRQQRGVPPKRKKNKDPGKLRSILSALLRMKFTVRRWVNGEQQDRKEKMRMIKSDRRSHILSSVDPASSSTQAATRLQKFAAFSDVSSRAVPDQILSNSGEKNKLTRRATTQDRGAQQAQPGNQYPHSPSHLTAISEEFSNLLDNLHSNRIQLISGERRLNMTGMAGVSKIIPRPVQAFRSIDSEPATSTEPPQKVLFWGSQDQKEQEEHSLLDNLDPASPVQSMTPSLGGGERSSPPRHKKTRSITHGQRSGGIDYKRSSSMPVTSEGDEQRDSEVGGERETLMFGTPSDRLNMMMRFKKTFIMTQARKNSMRRKFAENRKRFLTAGEGANHMNDTVQSLDQLKKLDNDFAKKLKDAHFVISNEDPLSSSYADVIKDPQIIGIMREMRRKSSNRRLQDLNKKAKMHGKKKPVFQISQVTDQDLSGINRTFDLHDGRLNLFQSRKQSVDYLGNQEKRRKVIKWKPERKITFDKSYLDAYSDFLPERSFDMSKSQIHEMPPPAQHLSLGLKHGSTRPFSPRSFITKSLFTPPLEADLGEQIPTRSSFTEGRQKKDRRYRVRQKYLLDAKRAQIVDLQREDQNESYENIAPYFLQLANSLVASGGSLIDIEAKRDLTRPGDGSRTGTMSLNSRHISFKKMLSIVSQAPEMPEAKVRPYKAQKEYSERIQFLQFRLEEVLEGAQDVRIKDMYEKSLFETPAATPEPNMSDMSPYNSGSSQVDSPAGSVGGIGAFSLCNEQLEPNKPLSREDKKRRKIMKKLRNQNPLRSSVPPPDRPSSKTSSSKVKRVVRTSYPELEFSKFKGLKKKEKDISEGQSQSKMSPKVTQLFKPNLNSDAPSIFARKASTKPKLEDQPRVSFQFLLSSRRGSSRARSKSVLMNFTSYKTVDSSDAQSTDTELPDITPAATQLNEKQKEKLIQSMKSQVFPSEAVIRPSRKGKQAREKINKSLDTQRGRVEWSGQDVFLDMDRSTAWGYTQQLSKIKVRQKGCCGMVRYWRDLVKKFVNSGLFENFMTICVTINTVALAMDHYGIEASLNQTLTDMNLVFTIIFCIEMGLKLIGLGPLGYLNDAMNYLDGIIVILSIVEITIFNAGGNNAISAFRSVRIFRTFRVLRVARLLRALKSMHQIISVIGRSLSSFTYLAVLLLLFMFIYALLGIQLFGTILSIPYFSNFLSAFVSAFQVMTLENWQEILYATAPKAGSLSTLYFVSWIFIGNFILLNLFLAILLDSFLQEGNAQEQRSKQEQKLKTSAPSLKRKKSQRKLMQRSELRKSAEAKMMASIASHPVTPSSTSRLEKPLPHPAKSIILSVPQSKSTIVKKKPKKKKKVDVKRPSILQRELDQDDLAEMKEGDIKAKRDYEREVKCEQALFFLPKRTRCRRCLYNLQKHYWFERVIIILIVLSTVKLIYDTYTLDASQDIKDISDALGLFFTVSFTLQSLIKSLALGFALDEGSYLTEGWNQLDFFIVVTSLLDLALINVQIPAIKVLRILRTLRPLRFISHNSQMKTVVTALIHSISGIFNVVIVVLIVWLMFAILGVSLFMGKFGNCTQNGVEIYETSKAACIAGGGSFVHYDSNFNNVLQALLTLFIVASLQGWPNIKDVAIRAEDTDISLCEGECSPYNALFFVFFILIGSFFFLNLFVGVIFLHFQDTQKLERANLQVKDEHWITMQRLILKAKPELESKINHTNCFRARVHRFVKHYGFQAFIMVCIILNMLQMAISYYDAPDQYNYVLQLLNYIFTAIFTLEAILKLISYGILYFKSNWNVFDFIVVLGSLLDIILNSLDQSSLKFLRVGPQLARVLRVLRVTRLLRLVNRLKGLQLLIQTVIFSVGALTHVFLLLMILFFIYSILGVFLFSEVTGGEAISQLNNFSNFGYSMLSLLRMATGEDWHLLMYDTMHGRQCKNGIPGSCAVSYSPIYFISFVVLCTFVVLNLFILVILQQFETYYLPQNNLINSFKNDLETFNSVWTRYSRQHAGQMIPSESVKNLLKQMNHPLGTNKLIGRDEMIFVLKLNLFNDERGMIHFHEMLYKLMKQAYGQPSENLRMLKSEISTVRSIRKRIQETNLKLKAHKKHQGLTAQQEKELLEGEQGKKRINPVILALYLNMSLRIWRKMRAKKAAAPPVSS